MTAPTIPPQQPEPERVCGNCQNKDDATCHCSVWSFQPPFDGSCDRFRARKES